MTKTNNDNNQSNESQHFDFEFTTGKIALIALSILLIGGVSIFGLLGVPAILENTTESQFQKQQASSSSKALESKANLEKQLKEEGKLTFTNREVQVKFANYGDLKIKLLDQLSPKTVENFVRFVSRKAYDGNIIHRMVEQDNFAVIQGGQFSTSDAGTTANGSPLKDELWEIAPIIVTSPQGESTVTNEPKLKESPYYTDFNKEKGTLVYKKGLILMAKTRDADSATSQFFITLKDTTLPAQYTIFGDIDVNTFATLDKISTEVDPAATSNQASQATVGDGQPNKEIKIESMTLI
jgi:cyclophilin family peptidyl-prolyl cis-trans isomerase